MEIAGVVLGAVALVPPTLQLIDNCASFYGDVSQFGISSRQLNLRFLHLRSRYDAMQRVLFQKAKFTFAAENLFDLLPKQDQKIIHGMFRELAELFYKHYMLCQTYRLGSESSPAGTDGIESLAALLVTPDANIQRLKPNETSSSLLSVRHIWWATRGKKKAEKLLGDFEGWLRRIKDILEDTWWILPALEKHANLKSIESDKDAEEVGISANAGLKKLLLDTSQVPAELNLDTVSLDIEYFSQQRGTTSLHGQSVLVEAFRFEPDRDGFVPQTLGRRFETIANLLHMQQHPELRVLRCKGYRYSSHPVSQFQLLLETPSGCNPRPVTLKDVLGLKMRMKPDLAQRFQLCWRVSQCLIALHSVGWLHRALSAENIICFLPVGLDLKSDDLVSYFFEHFVLSGFDSSRLETDFSLGPYDNEISKNIYRHPERWGAPKRTFSRLDDIYALGVVLLEIGLWEKALYVGGNDFVKHSRDAGTTSSELRRQADLRLGHRCGNKFRRIVLSCLTGEFLTSDGSDTEIKEAGLQTKFRGTVVDSLHRLSLEI